MSLLRGKRKQAAGRVRPAEGGARGFTLAETVIALLILMVAGLGVASLFAYSITNNSRTRDRELAMAVAQTRLEYLRSIPFDVTTRAQAYNYPRAGNQASGGLAATGAGGVTEDVVAGGRPYRVVTVITNDGGVADASSSSKTITVTVAPLGDTGNLGRVRLAARRAAVMVGAN
jgi:Tfp pilus assembly protein PilV